ncbi:MAG: hypothetical protein IIZ68_05840 [Clostridia bacterium]|nr:hypothetical protein [Clostridia bacterium]
MGDSTVTVTLTGSPDDLDEVLSKFGEYPIVEMTRSGMSAIEASDRPFVEMDDAEFIN